MYRNKIPKSQRPSKSPYTSYNPHSKPLTDRQWNQGFYRVVSIDPSGRSGKNFGFRIETRPGPNDFGPIKSEAFLRYSLPTPKDEDEETCMNANFDLLSSFLDSHLKTFLETHIILIERQLPENYCAVRYSQHIISYFLIKLKDTPLLPLILEVDSKLKLKQLDIPSGLTKKDYKNRLVHKAIELLTKRGDDEAVKFIQKSKLKPDDICDCVCQIEAVFSYLKWPLTKEKITLKIGSNGMAKLSKNEDD